MTISFAFLGDDEFVGYAKITSTEMAAESNMGFQQGTMPSFFHNRHMVSFQSGAVNSSNRIVPTVTDSFGAVDSTSGMTFSGNPGGGSTLLIPPERASGVPHLDPFPELKHDTGLAVFWSFEEQLLLEDGLAKWVLCCLLHSFLH